MSKKIRPQLISEQEVESMHANFLKFMNSDVAIMNRIFCNLEFCDKDGELDEAVFRSMLVRYLIFKDIEFHIALDADEIIQKILKTQRNTTKRSKRAAKASQPSPGDTVDDNPPANEAGAGGQ